MPITTIKRHSQQPFWGSMVHRAGAGPEPIPAKQLTAEKLAAAIAVCLKGETQAAAQRMAQQISQENGPEFGAKHFHAMLPLDRMRCACDSKSAAVWRLRHSDIRLGTLAAAVLLDKELIKIEDIKL